MVFLTPHSLYGDREGECEAEQTPIPASQNTEEAAANPGLAREPGPRHLQGKRSDLGKGLARDTSGNTTDKWLKCFLYLDFHPVALGKELTRDFKEGTM